MNGDWLTRIHPSPNTVGSGSYPPGWTEPLHTIYDHELVLVFEGTCALEIQGQRQLLAAPSYVVVPPGRLQTTHETQDKPLTRRWVHFDWIVEPRLPERPLVTFAPGTVETDHICYPPPYVPSAVLAGRIQFPERVFQLHARLERAWNGGSDHDRVMCRAWLLALLLELLDETSRETRPGPSERNLASRARAALETFARVPMRRTPPLSQFFQQRLNASHAHVCRVFKKAQGISPAAYVRALRIERARRLLRDTNLPIAEVAFRVGFDSPAHFSRLFHRLVGCSPRDYAERERIES